MRSACAVCGVLGFPASECVIPDDVGMKVQRLLWMYGKPGPQVLVVIRVSDVDDNNDDSDNEADDVVVSNEEPK